MSKIKEPSLVIHKSKKLTFYDLYLMRLLAQTVRFSSNTVSEKGFLKQHSNNCREESVLSWFKNNF